MFSTAYVVIFLKPTWSENKPCQNALKQLVCCPCHFRDGGHHEVESSTFSVRHIYFIAGWCNYQFSVKIRRGSRSKIFKSYSVHPGWLIRFLRSDVSVIFSYKSLQFGSLLVILSAILNLVYLPQIFPLPDGSHAVSFAGKWNGFGCYGFRFGDHVHTSVPSGAGIE